MKTMLLLATTLLFSIAQAETYKLDVSASNLEWKAGKKIGGGHHGGIKIKSGEVVKGPKGEITSASVTIDMKTISNEDLKGSPDYQKKLVDHLSNEDFFNVTKFPEAQFTLKSLKPKAGSKTEYTAKGDLTMIGVTKPIEFPVTITEEQDRLTAKGKVIVQRLNWGLRYGSGSIFKSLTADKIINDQFELDLNLVATKAK